jgi:hypothetical protein
MSILGLDPNCYTGGDCWNYDYSDRWLLLFGITLGIIATYRIIKKITEGKDTKD